MNTTCISEMRQLDSWIGPRVSGRVSKISGLLVQSTGPKACLGELCYIYNKKGNLLPAQVVGFEKNTLFLMPLGDCSSLSPGAEVYPTGMRPRIPVGEALKGRIINALGEPLDQKGEINCSISYSLYRSPVDPMKREPISKPLETGIKVIDGMLTMGLGQRMGIFSGPGGGKSTLLGMLARMASSDVIVLALIGERGREVREFLDRELGNEGLKKTIVVTTTADEPPPLRVFGAYAAISIAEYFCHTGKNILLLMDSLTRFAWAQRELSLALGELPSARGYPPSVFALLPRLLERCANGEKGTLTSIFTVLCEEEEKKDPLVEHIRSLIDGHIFLSPLLAEGGYFPAVDILKSLSRVMPAVTSPHHVRDASKIRSLLRAYTDHQDLISLGAYVKGTNRLVDESIEKQHAIESFFKQGSFETSAFDSTVSRLSEILKPGLCEKKVSSS